MEHVMENDVKMILNNIENDIEYYFEYDSEMMVGIVKMTVK